MKKLKLNKCWKIIGGGHATSILLAGTIVSSLTTNYSSHTNSNFSNLTNQIKTTVNADYTEDTEVQASILFGSDVDDERSDPIHCMLDPETHILGIIEANSTIYSLNTSDPSSYSLRLNQGVEIPGYDGITFYILEIVGSVLALNGFATLDFQAVGIDPETEEEYGLQNIQGSNIGGGGQISTVLLPHTLSQVSGDGTGTFFNLNVDDNLALNLNWSAEELQDITLWESWIDQEFDRSQIYIGFPEGTQQAYIDALDDILFLTGANICLWQNCWEDATNIFGPDCTGQVYVEYESTLKQVKIIPSGSNPADIGGTTLVLNKNITIQSVEGYTLTQIATNSITNTTFSLETIDLSNAPSSLVIENDAFKNIANVSNLMMPQSLITLGTNCFENIFSNQGSGTLTLQWSKDQINSATFPTNWITSDSSVLNSDTICNIPARTYSAYDSLRTKLSLYHVTLNDPEPPIDASVIFNTTSSLEGNIDTVVDQDNFTITIWDGQNVSGTNLTLNRKVQLEAPYKPGLYTITSIQYNAFEGDTNLCGRLDLSGNSTNDNDPLYLGMSCFSECTNLTELILPDSLDETSKNNTWREECFSGCVKLETVHLPRYTKMIPDLAFSHCYKLVNVNWDEMNDLTCIGEGSFEKCSSIKEISLSGTESLRFIKMAAFAYCDSLQKVALPPHISILYKQCFALDTSLNEVNFSDLSDLVDIDEDAFAFTNLSEVDLSNSTALQVINEGAFSSCPSLKIIKMPSIPASWMLPYFGGLSTYWLGDGGNRPFSQLEEIDVPEAYYDDYIFYLEYTQGDSLWYTTINPKVTPYSPSPSPTPTPTPSGDGTSLGLTLGLSIGLGVSLIGVVVGWIAYAIQANKSKKIE